MFHLPPPFLSHAQYAGYNEGLKQARNETMGLPGNVRHNPSSRTRRPAGTISTREVAMRPVSRDVKERDAEQSREWN